LHESGSLQGNETVAVGRAPLQPQGRVTTLVVVHCGTKQDPHAVAVLVSVGQLTVVQGLVVVTVAVVAEVMVLVSVLVVVAVVVRMLVLMMVDVAVAVTVFSRM
jgi:hypothetical protein